MLIYGEHLWSQTFWGMQRGLAGLCSERVTPVALQREKEVPGHRETEAVVFNKSTPVAGQVKGNCTE